MSAEKQYLDIYHSFKERINRNSCLPLNRQRESAAKELEEKGIAKNRKEFYRYTKVDEALSPNFGINIDRLRLRENPYQTYQCDVEDLETWNLFVINDIIEKENEALSDMPEGVLIESFKNLAENHSPLLEKFYHKMAGRAFDPITALNTMLIQDGIVVYIPEGVQLQKAIQIINVSSANVDLMSNRRILLIVEKGAKGTVLCCDHVMGGRKYLTTQVVEIYAQEDAELEFYSVEETDLNNTRFCNLYVDQYARSHVGFNGLTLHNGISRNSLELRLMGEGASVKAVGAGIADKREHIDNYILVDHVAENCTSDLLYKYVLDGKAVGAYAGKVLVRPGAQKSYSEQNNANICSANTARAYSQPMLEIYADDVKCNHGSTIGKLDETALFYMRQRGIPESEARLLLQHAFINEVLKKVHLEQLRKKLSHLVELRFRGQLKACQGCAMSVKKHQDEKQTASK